MLYGQVNVPLEFKLASGRPDAVVPDAVDVDVVFADGDGREWTVPAFRKDERAFGVRFAAPAEGEYTWRSACTDADDPGLHGREGRIEIGPYTGANPLYRHGRVRAAADTPTLEHADGEGFLWLADTWWMGLASRLDWPDGFRELAADRARKGFNVIQLVVGPFPDFSATEAAFDPQQANEGGWSWAPGWERINPAYFDQADLRIARLVELGLVPCIVGTWGYYLPTMGVERVRRHWRNLIARYAAWPVVWCLAGETAMPAYPCHGDDAAWERESRIQRDGWTEIARAVRERDPFGNLITTHPSCPSFSRRQLNEPDMVDLDMLQTGHAGYFALPSVVSVLAEAVAERPRIPVLNGEPCYEGIMGGSGPEIQRFCFWASITGGACGHTYGAQGIWAMSSPDEPFRGTTHDWGPGFWQDVMHYDGSRQVGLARKFLLGLPWRRFTPLDQPHLPEGRLGAYVCGDVDAAVICYLPVNCVQPEMLGMLRHPWWGADAAPLTLAPDRSYAASWFNPRTGKRTEIGRATTDAEGLWTPPDKPDKTDWVLVLVADTPA